MTQRTPSPYSQAPTCTAVTIMQIHSSPLTVLVSIISLSLARSFPLSGTEKRSISVQVFCLFRDNYEQDARRYHSLNSNLTDSEHLICKPAIRFSFPIGLIRKKTRLSLCSYRQLIENIVATCNYTKDTIFERAH